MSRRRTAKVAKSIQVTVPAFEFSLTENDLQDQLDYLVYECLQEAIGKNKELKAKIVAQMKAEVNKLADDTKFEAQLKRAVKDQLRQQIKLALK